MCPCVNRNARPNNNQLITYSQCISYLLRIHAIPVDTTCNKICSWEYKLFFDKRQFLIKKSNVHTVQNLKKMIQSENVYISEHMSMSITFCFGIKCPLILFHYFLSPKVRDWMGLPRHLDLGRTTRQNITK